MKKLAIILSLIIISGSCALAEEKQTSVFKKITDRIQGKEEAPVTVKSNEEATALYSSNEINKALNVLLAIPDTDRTAQDWVLIGNILQDQEKTTDAAFMYQRAILINPNYYKPYYNLGNIYLEDEKPFLAIENYKKATKLKPDFSYAYYNMGCAYIKAGNLSRAKLAFLKAIEIKNTEPDFHYNLAYTYKKLNKPKQAKLYLEFYNKALEAKVE